MAKETKNESAPVTQKFVPKVAKRLTYPQLKLVNDLPVYFLFKDKIFTGKAIEPKEGEKVKQPPRLARGIDLNTGEECEMIVNAVADSVLNENYPSDGYVGKGFMLVKRKKEEGKAYNKFEVSELELD